MLLDKLDLEPEEDVLTVVRKHWFILATQLIGIVVVAILPMVLLTIVLQVPKAAGVGTLSIEGYTPFITFALAGWLLFCTFSAFVIWTHYYLDLWVITDRRIIAVEQIHFFNRTVAIFRLERLQDIEFSIKGLIQTFFNFGSISAQTAGHMEANFTSQGMPNPDALQATIQKAMDARLAELNNRPNLSASELAGE
jgi:Bacterial PH domain